MRHENEPITIPHAQQSRPVGGGRARKEHGFDPIHVHESVFIFQEFALNATLLMAIRKQESQNFIM